MNTWARIHTKLFCTIHDFSLFYDRKYLKTWKSENRKWLLANAIKRYEMELEELKTADIFRNNERLLQIGGFAKALRYIKKEYSPCQAALII